MVDPHELAGRGHKFLLDRGQSVEICCGVNLITEKLELDRLRLSSVMVGKGKLKEGIYNQMCALFCLSIYHISFLYMKGHGTAVEDRSAELRFGFL